MGVPNPCKDCKRRALHCHSYCREYIEFDEANQRDRATRLRIVQERDTLVTLELRRNRNIMTMGSSLRHGKSLGGNSHK